jgi:hypothetical protein
MSQFMVFTREICEERQRMMARTGKTGQQLERTSNTKEKLRIFNGKRENWHRSKRGLKAYCNQINYNAGDPIFYMIRDPEQEERYRAYNGDLGRRIYEARTKRTHFKSYRLCDNGPQVDWRKLLLTTITMYKTHGQS